MEPPAGDSVDAIRDEKARLLQTVLPLDPRDVVRGQYRGYREEPGVARDSQVETYAAVRLRIASPRWSGVPFLVRAGKRLRTTATEIRVQFKPPRCNIYRKGPVSPEYVRFRVGPDVTTIALGMHVMERGETIKARDIEMLAACDQALDIAPYERLLDEAMRGDGDLFARQDAIEAQWRIVDPVLALPAPPHTYDPGTWGPAEADRLAAPARWLEPIDPWSTS
jgi:glucose-6-phosphate 1-dehydrogenase